MQLIEIRRRRKTQLGGLGKICVATLREGDTCNFGSNEKDKNLGRAHMQALRYTDAHAMI
jgi:hypothetical protein